MVLVHALQHKKLMTECHVLRVQSGPRLKAAAKGEEQGSEEYEYSPCTLPRFAASSTPSMNTDFWVGTGPQLIATSRHVISPDGRSMTITTKSRSFPGKSVTTVGVYERVR
jgi:hypothetical protein